MSKKDLAEYRKSSFFGYFLPQDTSGEFIPLLSPEEEAELHKEEIADTLPILPVRNTVLFPGVVLPITVGRQKSTRLVKRIYRGNKIIGVAAQQNADSDEPSFNDLYRVGTVARILRMLVLPDGNTTIIIQGLRRFNVKEVVQTEPYLLAKIELLPENFPNKSKKEVSAAVRSLREAATRILKLNPEIPGEAQIAIDNIESPSFLTHFLSSNINVPVAEKQKLLETDDGLQRMTLLLQYLLKEIQMLELKQEIQSKVSSDIDQQQRDFYLRQQMKVLQDELGYEGPDKEVENLRMRGKQKKWPENVAQHFNKELDKILRLNPASAEYPVALNYAELLVDLPWSEYSKDNFDLKRARRILDKDHFGLEKVKDRIISYLAVLKLKQDMKAPILCLYGPPGVGKTSLGRSIAKALNRKYIRMSLGGVRDEAEIRGHRRTYVGAMPGKIIQNIKKAQSSNPVFILDEIDKIGSDFRGDPSSALLEVLDPEQNNAFVDNYIETEYDLSKVLFIATANSTESIQWALRDRMEIIEISGYILEEKVQIAKKYLIPKQKKEHGIPENAVSLSTKAIEKIIQDYTRESGVRNLERKIGALMRELAKAIAMNEPYSKVIAPKDVLKILGPETHETEVYESTRIAGVVTGLAWTQVGGEILYIESGISRGKGKLTLSGQLGDVMKESAVAALSYLRAHNERYDIDHRLFDNYDLHIHVPAGAVPKDGPSAGITILTSLASVFTQRQVKAKTAMTGEITLTGKVLPVGGIKEKILAAKRAGIQEIILCKRNKKDVDEIGKQYTEGLTFHYVSDAEEVLNIALLNKKVKNPLELIIEDNTAKV